MKFIKIVSTVYGKTFAPVDICVLVDFLAGADAFFFGSMNNMRCQPINMFCHLSCANGFEKDGSGCDICHCKGVGEIENAQEKYIRMTFRY